LVCLLPVRNGAEDLPGYLKSAGRFADAIVALDDGSTDATRELLAKAPLVEILLTNPRRDGYRQWDDRANRDRLLDAAADIDPAWILCLDADERFAPGDGEALREFVDTQALPGFAFAFTIFRMWDDVEHYDPAGYWVYRLFAFEPGQRFPDQRLHFDPIPTSIPRSRRLRTTLRIQHLAGMTAERRAARLEKYRQADPERVSGYRYPDLTEQPAVIRLWEPRPADQPVLLQVSRDGDAPALSAVVISRDDEQRIGRAVASVVGQEAPWPFEVIVVTSGTDRTAEIVRSEFPQVTLVELPQPALPGEARNAGLRIARGDYVSFPGSHVELPPGSLAARIRAHDEGYAMVTGTTLNGTRTRAGWASYFLDHSSVLPGRPSTVLGGPPAHCSYLREALLEVGGFPEDMRAGEDTVVNYELARRGYSACRAQDVTLVHHSPCRTARRLLRHHFVRGRAYGRILLDRRRRDGRLLHAHGLRALFRLQVRHRIAYTARRVERWGGEDLQHQHRRARHLVRAAALSYWLGTCYELFRPARAKAFVLWGRPVVTCLVDEEHAATLVSVDVLTRRAKVVHLPPGLEPDGLDVRIDGRLTRHAFPGGLFDVLRAVRGSGLGVRAGVTLAWGALTVRQDDVHEIWAGPEAGEITEQLNRYLDTRSRRERITPVAVSREVVSVIAR
jgi:glycosyltransferase involved in cell wall biosynthesis